MRRPRSTRAAQVVAAAILLFTAYMKLTGDPASIEVFARLGMEPGGRYVIGVIEVLASLLLLSPLAGIGALLGMCVMCGAIIAHVTILGLVVNDDGGLLVGMLATVLVCAGYVLVSRRKEIPFVGETL